MDDATVRIAALEQLVKAMLKDSRMNGTDPETIKKRAQGALLGGDCLGGHEQNSKACQYLDDLLG